MYKKSIIFALTLVFFLGMFYQFNRTDGFLYFMKNHNAVILAGTLKARPAFASSIKEKYLLIYDNNNVQNILLKRNLERLLGYHKKEVAVLNTNQKIDPSLPYKAIILAVTDLEKVREMPLLRNYVKEGGSLIFAVNPDLSPALENMAGEIGFQTLRDKTTVYGIKVKSDFMLKAKGFEFDEREIAVFDALQGTLAPQARVHLTAFDNTPLVWEHDYFKGKYIFYNAHDLHYKINRGIVTGMLALAQKNYLYPVLATKLFFIDDFPLPLAKVYNDTIREEYGLDMAEFIRNVWWPGMIRAGEHYDLKYTCMYIKGYGDQVEGSFDDN
ncbi:MAG: DUF2194 domain-containing protein, partial [Sporomusaceae bacterium]|nr:DUF2194 domain-containing protein [Sporomusaceae bacterium]